MRAGLGTGRENRIMGMRLTFTYAGQTVEGDIESAHQRCIAAVSYDEEEDVFVRCGVMRHPHRIDAWECGHDNAEGVIVVTMDNGAPGEVTFPLDGQWSPLLLAMGL